jgi:hypothetical protein
MELVTIPLHDQHRLATGAGPAAALYVMVTASGRDAKIGALEKAINAKSRLGQVNKKHPTQTPTPPPEKAHIRLTVVAELQGLVLGPPGKGFYERWAEVEHLESAMRLVLARRLGTLAAWTDWIHLKHPIDDEQWPGHVEDAWSEVCRLGRA